MIETFVRELIVVTNQMSPYLLFGFLFAGVLSLVLSPEKVERHLGGRGLGPIVKATLFGIPLPLCSCGVLPVAASLRKHGASAGATTAFLITTPQTGVDSIAVTYSLLGPVFATFRVAAAFVSGLICGVAVDRFGVTLAETKTSSAEKSCSCGCGHGKKAAESSAAQPSEDRTKSQTDGQAEHTSAGKSCCSHHAKKRSRWVEAMRYAFVQLLGDIAPALTVGLVLAAVINVALPDDFFAATIGTGFVAMLVMLGVGLPMYVCATASVPIAAALIMKGLSPGAALVFLVVGPAANAAAIAALWAVLGKRGAIVYLISLAGTALAAGVTLDAVLAHVVPMDQAACHAAGEMLPMWASMASSIVLCGLLAAALARRISWWPG